MGAGYVRIDPAYDLRGWQGLPHALVNRATGRASFVPEAVFHTLQLCNGKFTADSPLFMGVRKDHLKEFEKVGVHVGAIMTNGLLVAFVCRQAGEHLPQTGRMA